MQHLVNIAYGRRGGVADFAQTPPYTVPTVIPEPEKPVPKLGIGMLEFNSNGTPLVASLVYHAPDPGNALGLHASGLPFACRTHSSHPPSPLLTGSHLFSRNDNMPTTLWIWDILALAPVALLSQTHPVRRAAWNPVDPGMLAFCCGSGSLYLWEVGRGAEALEIPACKWVRDGLSMRCHEEEGGMGGVTGGT